MLPAVTVILTGSSSGEPRRNDHPDDSTGALLTPFLAVLDRGGLNHTGEPAGSGVFSSASRKSSGAAPFSTLSLIHI